MDLTEIDASDPNAVKISYSLPGNITFDSAVLEIGEEETLEKSNVNRTLEFTFNQDILVEPEDPLQYELDIRRSLLDIKITCTNKRLHVLVRNVHEAVYNIQIYS